jgi:hypothetical protein
LYAILLGSQLKILKIIFSVLLEIPQGGLHSLPWHTVLCGLRGPRRTGIIQDPWFPHVQFSDSDFWPLILNTLRNRNLSLELCWLSRPSFFSERHSVASAAETWAHKWCSLLWKAEWTLVHYICIQVQKLLNYLSASKILYK